MTRITLTLLPAIFLSLFICRGLAAQPTDGNEAIESVKIGVLVPLVQAWSVRDLRHAHEQRLGGQMLQGALLAVEEVNEQGGYGRIPFELILRNDADAWGSSSNTMVELNDEKVWAVLGSIDGEATHIALRVALSARLPMVNTGSTDPTLTETGIPWLVRIHADDRQQAGALARYIFEELGHDRVGALRVDNRYGRLGIAEFSQAARRLGRQLLFEFEYRLGDRDFSPQISRIKESAPDAVVIWGDAEDAGYVVRQMREMGVDVSLFGCSRLVDPTLSDIARGAAEGLVASYPFDPQRQDANWLAFKKRYAERFGEEPETFAAHGYDGIKMIAEAIDHVGLDRTRIRDRLAAMDRYEGVTGRVVLDASGNDVGPVSLARLENGSFVFFAAPLP